MCAPSAAGIAGALIAFGGGKGGQLLFPWPAVGGGSIGIDGLSAFFLIPVFIVGGLGSIYGLGYWPQTKHQGNGRRLRLFWGFLVAVGGEERNRK